MFVDMFKDLLIKVDKESNLFSSTQFSPQKLYKGHISHKGNQQLQLTFAGLDESKRLFKNICLKKFSLLIGYDCSPVSISILFTFSYVERPCLV